MNVPALLRNRRNHPWPDVVGLGRAALAAGAVGLTVHPRPDERHTRPSDVRALKALITHEFPDRELNIEGYPDARFIELVQEVGPDQVTLVPDAPDQATSDHGWDFAREHNALSGYVAAVRAPGRRVALFADADADVMIRAADTGADRVELYTGPFGACYDDPEQEEIELTRLSQATEAARAAGLEVNAGHDLTVPGTKRLVERIPAIAEVSIGHALFCDALAFGIDETVRRYLASCAAAPATGDS